MALSPRRDLDRLADMRDALTDVRALTADGKQTFEADRSRRSHAFDDQLVADGRVRLGWADLCGMSVPPGRKYGVVDSLSCSMT